MSSSIPPKPYLTVRVEKLESLLDSIESRLSRVESHCGLAVLEPPVVPEAAVESESDSPVDAPPMTDSEIPALPPEAAQSSEAPAPVYHAEVEPPVHNHHSSFITHPSPASPPSPPSPPSDFLTSSEMSATSASPAASAPDEGWEIRLATRWLPRIGGVLLLAGAAMAGTLITPMMPPFMRLLMGYLLAGGFGVAGAFVLRRNEIVGRAVIGIAASLAYFLGFASHFLPPVRVFGNAVPALILMSIPLGAIVYLADRWRSQPVAAMGLLLGVLAILVSAGTSQAFALVGLGFLALAGGAVLLRHEWQNLTGIMLAAVYTSMLALWVFYPVPPVETTILVHMTALILYNLIFTAAFARWGRVWVARELAADRNDDARPDFDPGVLPYSTAFSILNTAGLIGLSLYLFWSTKVLMPKIDLLLFGLAALEAARLAIPALRRGHLSSFHAVASMALVAGGIVAAFDGPVECAALAAQTLIVAIAASRARVLRVLRPLSFITAGLAMAAFDVPAGTVYTVTFLHMIPALLLLASVLPWESMFVSRAPKPLHPALYGLDMLSAQVRGGLAALAIAALWIPYGNDGFRFSLLSAASAVVPLLALCLLRARGVLSAALILTVASLTAALAFCLQGTPDIGAAMALLLPQLALGWLWLDAGRKESSKPGLVFHGLVIAIPTLLCIFLSLAVAACIDGAQARGATYLSGIYIAAIAAVWSLIGWAGSRAPRIPVVIAERETEGIIVVPPRWFTLPALVGIGGFACAGIAAAFMDAQLSLISAFTIAAVGIAAWLVSGKGRENWRAQVPALGALAMMFVSAIVRFQNVQGALLAGLICFAFLVLAWSLRRGALVATTGLAGLRLAALLGLLFSITTWTDASAFPLLLLAVLDWLNEMAIVSRKSFSQYLRLPIANEATRTTFTVVAVVGALIAVSSGAILSTNLVTVSWGLIGAVLMAVGLAKPDRVSRYVSLGVFALAIGRIFLVDLTGASLLTRAVAFLGIGVLLVAAALGYAVLSKRMSKEEGKEMMNDE